MSKRIRIHEAQRNLYKKAKKQGWTLESTRNCHVKWVPPSGKNFVVHPSTSSDWRSIKNLKSLLVNRGLEL